MAASYVFFTGRVCVCVLSPCLHPGWGTDIHHRIHQTTDLGWLKTQQKSSSCSSPESFLYSAFNVSLHLTFLRQISNINVRQSGPLSQFLPKCRLPYARRSWKAREIKFQQSTTARSAGIHSSKFELGAYDNFCKEWSSQLCAGKWWTGWVVWWGMQKPNTFLWEHILIRFVHKGFNLKIL